ncbi:MAG TPA: cupin domain-containing protein [Solirubrobacterales bacterium]|nr:cupin domain-containing protein [Solirubrobacterales bacterium]
MSESQHVASLTEATALFEGDPGSLRVLTSAELPVLRGISIKRLLLAPGSIREPHWHANASELTYCVKGDLLVSVLDDADGFSSFTISAGEMFYVASGSLHHIENLGSGEAELILAFSHERPEDFSMHAAFGAMSDAVLGNTYDLPAADFAVISRNTEPVYIVSREGRPSVPEHSSFDDPHKFAIEGQAAPIDSPAGSAKLARKQFWPIMEDLSMYSLRVTPDGMREPHWHPVTAELGYVVRGQARMTVMDPDGSTDTYGLGPGDVYFIPPAYPHHIEDTGQDDFHFLVFFDRHTPKDIGYRASASAISREVLAATLGIPETMLPKIPFTPEDPLIVKRANPVDPPG